MHLWRNNREVWKSGNNSCSSRRPLCFQMDTFPSSDRTRWTISLPFVFNKDQDCIYKEVLVRFPKIAYFPRNKLAVILCLLWRCAEGAKKRRKTRQTVGCVTDVLLDSARPAGPDVMVLPLLWTGTILGQRAGNTRLSRSSAFQRRFIKTKVYVLLIENV